MKFVFSKRDIELLRQRFRQDALDEAASLVDSGVQTLKNIGEEYSAGFLVTTAKAIRGLKRMPCPTKKK